ncbi:MAG: hypothetical protein KDD26_09715, partial [Winogradskyella sp.]|nr:hypothetical protein [Winogradskyella sp.]
MKNVNLEEKLNKLKNKNFTEDEVLKAVKDILTQDNKKDDRILEKLAEYNDTLKNNFDIDLLESDKIYHVEQIKKLCITYRLRFLDSRFFKGDLPYEAISKIKQLEKNHNTTLSG